jgi:hypothetical protein
MSSLHNENPSTTLLLPSFGEEDLEQAALLFGALKSLRAASTSTKTASMNDNSLNPQGDRLSILFDDHVRSVMTSLSTSLSSIKSTTAKTPSSSTSSSSSSSSSLRSVTILQHKANLFDLCDSQLVELSALNAPPLGVVAQRLRDLKKGLINSFVSVVQEQHVTSQALIEKEKNMTQRAENEVSELLQAAQLLERELVSCQEALKKSKIECDEKEKERLQISKQLLETEQSLRERERELGLSLNNSAAITANAALSALYSSSSSSSSVRNEQPQPQTNVVTASNSSKPTLLEQPTIQQSAISSDVSFLRQRLGLSVAPQQQLQPITSSSFSSSSSPFKSMQMQQSSPMALAPPLQSSFRSSPQFSLSPSASALASNSTFDRLVVGSNDGSVRLFDSNVLGSPLWVRKDVHQMSVTCVAFVEKGDKKDDDLYLVTGSADAQLVLLPITAPPQKLNPRFIAFLLLLLTLTLALTSFYKHLDYNDIETEL